MTPATTSRAGAGVSSTPRAGASRRSTSSPRTSRRVWRELAWTRGSGFVDREDRLVIPHGFRSGGRSGKASPPVCVSVDRKDLHGYIDRAGALVIEPRWRLAYAFSERLGLVLDGATYRYLFLDPRGDIAVRLPPSIGHAYAFSEGLALASVAEIRPYNDGSGFYPMSGGRFGFVDRSGSFVIEPQFRVGVELQRGLAPAKRGRGCGYIDRTGSFVVPPEYDGVGAVTEGAGPNDTRGRHLLRGSAQVPGVSHPRTPRLPERGGGPGGWSDQPTFGAVFFHAGTSLRRAHHARMCE